MKISRSLSFETGPASPRTTAIGMAVAASVLLFLAIYIGRLAYEYDIDGQRTQGEVIGETVPLAYPQNNPSGARVDSAAWLYVGPLIFGIMSALFYAGAAFVWRARARFQKDYVARRGRTIVSVVKNDGSITQTTHSSVPVFRWTGVFLAGLGTVACLGALWLAVYHFDPSERPVTMGLSIFFAVLGSMLLLGGAASLRHAKFLRNLEGSAGGPDN